MITLVAARRIFHIAQEGVHFRQGKLAAGTDGAVAGHGGEDVVFVFFDGLAAADLGEFAQNVFGLAKRRRLCRAWRGRRGRRGCCRPSRTIPARSLPAFRHDRKGGAFFVGRGKGYGNKQALALQVAVFLTLAFHFLVVDAFGGSVHIDEQKAVFGLGKDVDA